ncbi:kinase-like protein [Myriangium duriaei CBS 260.36]|uniref:Kinase-like protein n=1 Tax=Myriangium duriaei CBS 260.36 TaxID=1168546 RepID=A0A9P4MFI4_9PEZI|nr:kinase-like protein [Myriangium duriaei CBS 260.36]
MSVHADPPPPLVTEPYGTNYATSNQLGKGGFAICYKAERLEGDRPTGHMVALKIVRMKMEPAKLAQKFITELQIHSKLSHPNIVAFHRAFAFTENTYVVLELCSNGSLADMLKRRKCVTMPEIRRFMIQVCGAVKYLHARNIVHRDLKTGNLFLDEHMNVKVGDFGLAALLVSGKDMDAKRRTTMCGTPNYLAPEILEKGKGHNEKVDLWAIGIISYTLAVGKAPFHAASKEEIYKKLKAGEYTWPELSSITNDISADLRTLVQSLLVPEELRPNPDKIVSHAFFKMAFVPQKMSRIQVSKTPTWPIQPPNPEAIKRGYTESWYNVCKETGVGEYEEDKCFALNGGQRIRSVVKDIEKEVAAGRQPVIPIPADTIYTPYPNGISWNTPIEGLAEIAEEREVPIVRHLKELSHNEVQAVVSSRRQLNADTDAKRKRDAELMPPPRRRNDLSVRKTRAETDKPKTVAVPEPVTTTEAPRKMSAASAARAAMQSYQHDEVENKDPEADQTKPRAADATLARRPRSVRRQPTAQTSTPAAETEPTTSTVRRAPSTRTTRTRTKQAAAEVIEIFDEEQQQQQQPAQVHNLVLPPAPVMSGRLPVPARKPVDAASVLSGSTPDAVLERLHTFRNNLVSALQNTTAHSRKRSAQSPPNLPFVSRWVDYSRKHGVGYVLEDGTVGFIATSNAEAKVPVMHVAARNGERWLKRIGKRFENLDKVPLHILEDQEGGIGRVRSLAMTEEQRERIKTLRVLWVKFGRYMSLSLNSAEDSDGADKSVTQGDLQFVRFYQRMGNVGIWVFADGCIQLHFPDHTKLVFSADGLYISATLVSEQGAAAMSAQNELPAELLRDRQVLAHSTESFLQAARSSSASNATARLVRANMLEEKLLFVVQVLDQWTQAGGVGCSKEGDARLRWDGLWVKDHAKKVDWITVGRYGGD